MTTPLHHVSMSPAQALRELARWVMSIGPAPDDSSPAGAEAAADHLGAALLALSNDELLVRYCIAYLAARGVAHVQRGLAAELAVRGIPFALAEAPPHA